MPHVEVSTRYNTHYQHQHKQQKRRENTNDKQCVPISKIKAKPNYSRILFSNFINLFFFVFTFCLLTQNFDLYLYHMSYQSVIKFSLQLKGTRQSHKTIRLSLFQLHISYLINGISINITFLFNNISKTSIHSLKFCTVKATRKKID